MEDLWITPFWQAMTLPPRMTVCGVGVAPLTVWQVFALENLGNALVCGGPVDAGDALQMIVVASRSRRQFLRMFARPGAIRRATDRARIRLLRCVWRRRIDPVAEALAYVDACMRLPHRWRKGGEGKPLSVPQSLHMLRAAVRCGVGYECAWDMPYAQARALFDADAEARGDSTIMDAVDQQIDERMAAENRREAVNG